MNQPAKWYWTAASIVVALVAVLAYAFVIPAISDGEESTKHVETSIAEDYSKKAKALDDPELVFDPLVVCPDKADQSAKASFVCFIYDEAEPETQVATATVTFQNKAGDYFWEYGD